MVEDSPVKLAVRQIIEYIQRINDQDMRTYLEFKENKPELTSWAEAGPYWNEVALTNLAMRDLLLDHFGFSLDDFKE